MNKFLITLASSVCLLMSSSLFAQSSNNAALSITFANMTGGDIEYVPIISGDVMYLDGAKATVQSKDHADVSIKIFKIRATSAVFIKQNNQPIARLNFYKKGNSDEVQVCFIPSTGGNELDNVDRIPDYKFKFSILGVSSYKPSQSTLECADWYQSQMSSLILIIDKAR